MLEDLVTRERVIISSLSYTVDDFKNASTEFDFFRVYYTDDVQDLFFQEFCDSGSNCVCAIILNFYSF